MRPKVVLLLSDKRSGSTILQDELTKHEAIQTVAYSPHTYLETQYWLAAARLLGQPRAAFYANRIPLNVRRRSSARAYLQDLLARNLGDWTPPPSEPEMIRAGWEALCARFARPVFFEKSPQHIAHWGALSSLLDWMRGTSMDVRIIGLVRNPMAVLYSSERLFGTDPGKRQHGWSDMHRNLIAFATLIPPQQYHQLSYESMITDPITTLAKVCEFIGVEPDSKVGEGVHASSRNRWLEDQSFTAQASIGTQQIAAHFGYSRSSLLNEGKRKPTPARVALANVSRISKQSRASIVNGLIRPALLARKRRPQ